MDPLNLLILKSGVMGKMFWSGVSELAIEDFCFVKGWCRVLGGVSATAE